MRRPAGAARIAGMALTATAAVAMSPCVPRWDGQREIRVASEFD